MTLEAKFSVEDKRLTADLGTFQDLSDGGYERGLEEGRQGEYDRFWDALQDYGNRTAYSYAFAHGSWNDETFKPKYDLHPVGDATNMFRSCKITDLKGILERQGVVLDTSQATSPANMFYECRKLTRLPSIDLTNSSTTFGFSFSYCSDLVSIDKIILNQEGALSVHFDYCVSLEHIRFEGIIGQALELRWSSKLTGGSVQDIIDHLKDLTGQAEQTLTFHADVGARLTDAQKATVTAKNWTLVY